MTLTLELTPELQDRLKVQAKQRGMSERELALDLLKRHLPPIERKQRLNALLDSIVEESRSSTESESEESEATLKAIDEDRTSDRKLYPPELKGKTW